MPGQARLDVTGTLHHIIPRGIVKGPIFDDYEDRETFVQRMRLLPLVLWLLLNEMEVLYIGGGKDLKKLEVSCQSRNRPNRPLFFNE
jgi:hypothetical protein